MAAQPPDADRSAQHPTAKAAMTPSSSPADAARTLRSAPSPGGRGAAGRRGPSRRRAVAGTALAAAALLGLSGCGLSPSASYVPAFDEGSIAPVDGAEQIPVNVVSKNFTEQLILGKILVLAAEAGGYDVTDQTNVPGSQPVRQMMISGEGDLTIEYTGTAWLTYMGHPEGIPDPQEQWQAVAEEDRGNGLIWGEPGPFNNTYALAVRTEYAQEQGLEKISDLHDLPAEERTICVEAEFNSRPDGLTPLLEHYGLDRGEEIPEENIGIYDTGAIYTATDDGACNVGEVFSTDGRILALDLTVLEDDEQYFPAYNGSPVYNEQTLAEAPELAQIMEQIMPRLNNDTLRELNAQVDVEGREPVDVAYDWMAQEGFIAEPAA